MRHFLDTIENGDETITDLSVAMKTLQIILAAKESAMDGRKKILTEEQ